MSLELEATKLLRTVSTVTAQVGVGESIFSTFIFRGELGVAIEGTGTSAIVVSSRSGWSASRNGQRFPYLQVEIYSDPDRDPALNPEERQTAREKAEGVFMAVDDVFHIPERGEVQWGSLRILSSLRSGEPDFSEVPDGDGLLRALVRYEVSMG